MSIHPLFQVINEYLLRNPDPQEMLLPNVENAFVQINNHGLNDIEHGQDLNLLALNFTLPTELEFENLVEGDEWDLFQLRNVQPNRNGLGVILARTPWSNSNTALPPPQSHHTILHHTYQFEIHYENSTIPRRALIYPKFATLQNYCENLPQSCDITVVQDALRPFIRNYVLGLLDLHKDGLFNGQINLSSLIIVEGEGKFLCPSTVAQCTTVNDFLNLGVALESLADLRSWGLEIAGSPGTALYGLARLIKFLISRSFCRPDHCIWMRYFPYIMTDEEKVFDFIPRLYHVADKCRQFQNKLASKALNWTATSTRARQQYYELARVFNHNGQARFWQSNYHHFLKFLRNCVAHLDTHKSHAHRTKPGEARSHYSILMQNCSIFIGIINSIEPNFFEDIWMEAVINLNLDCLVERLHPSIS